MITAMILIFAVAILAALVATIIHQKARAYSDCYREEVALSELSPRKVVHAAGARQLQPARVRRSTYAPRKAEHASGFRVCL